MFDVAEIVPQNEQQGGHQDSFSCMYNIGNEVCERDFKIKIHPHGA